MPTNHSIVLNQNVNSNISYEAYASCGRKYDKSYLSTYDDGLKQINAVYVYEYSLYIWVSALQNSKHLEQALHAEIDKLPTPLFHIDPVVYKAWR